MDNTFKKYGATLQSNGVAFKIWAPYADRVFVIGDFNQWAEPGILMNREPNGDWTQLVLNARSGNEYRYLIEHKGEKFLRNDPYARDLTHSNGNSVIFDPHFEWKHPDYQIPQLHEMVIYEMHIGTFNDEPGGAPGNFNTAIERLDHLVDLGINVIEIMPAMEFPGGFSWGYNPSFIFAVETEYGGPNALKSFIDAAHNKNIMVILDVVYNHWGPGDLGLWQFDGWQENNMGGIYFYNDWRAKTPWGDTRPDYGRTQVRNYIFDNIRMWIEEYHMDGFRWDMTPYIRTVSANDHAPGEWLFDGWRLMQDINSQVRKDYPEKIIIAEDLHKMKEITRKVKHGGAGFHAQWCAEFVHPVRDVLIQPNDIDRDMTKISNAVQFMYNGKSFQRVIYTESHDEVANGHARLPEDIWPGNADSWFSKKRSMLGAVLVFTCPGIPMIFQGQEMLMDKWFSDTEPIDWSFKEQFKGIFIFYRDLVALRTDQALNCTGLMGEHVNVFHINHQDKVIAYHRWDQGGPADDVIVVLNFSNKHFPVYDIGVPMQGKWYPRLMSENIKYDLSFDKPDGSPLTAMNQTRDQLDYTCRVHLAPYSAIVLSQQ